MWPGFLNKLNYFAAFGNKCDPTKDNPDNPFFGFPHWWQYINEGTRDAVGHCEPVVSIPGGLWAIAFAVIDMLLYLAGIIAVVSIIIAGIMYLTSGGNTEKAVSARRRIINSLVGLAIVISAAAIVSFIGNRVG